MIFTFRAVVPDPDEGDGCDRPDHDIGELLAVLRERMDRGDHPGDIRLDLDSGISTASYGYFTYPTVPSVDSTDPEQLAYAAELGLTPKQLQYELDMGSIGIPEGVTPLRCPHGVNVWHGHECGACQEM